MLIECHHISRRLSGKSSRPYQVVAWIKLKLDADKHFILSSFGIANKHVMDEITQT